MAANLKQWKVGTEEAVAATAMRQDDFAMRWVRGAGQPDIDEDDLMTVPPRFCTLDHRLRTAIRASAQGTPFEPEVAEMDENNRPSSLVYLRRLYNFLSTSDRKQTLRAVTDLQNVRWMGLNDVGKFLRI